MKNKDLRIAIIGAGPSGGILGAHLAEKNPDLVLVDVWQSHIDAIKNHGLKLIGFNTITANFKRENLLTSSRDLKEFNPNLENAKVYKKLNRLFMPTVLDLYNKNRITKNL